MKNSFYILLISIWSCGNAEFNQDKLLNSELQVKDIILIDTFSNKLMYDTASLMTIAEFHPMYINPKKDSIVLNYNTRDIKSINFWSIEEWSEEFPDSLDIVIHVDTSQIIGSADFFPTLKKENDVFINKRGHIKSYPVFIESHSKDTMEIGFGDYIPLIIEAVDSLGEWKPIQTNYIYGCGTGLFPIQLPANEILITSCKLFEGEYKTRMRLSYGFVKTNTSNEFYGKMNYPQFNGR